MLCSDTKNSQRQLGIELEKQSFVSDVTNAKEVLSEEFKNHLSSQGRVRHAFVITHLSLTWLQKERSSKS
jgi:hypothetical protein